MKSGYQIYKCNFVLEECFINAGLHNWFPTLEEANQRKIELEASWPNVQYVVVKCATDN